MNFIRYNLRKLIFYSGGGIARKGWRMVVGGKKIFILFYHKVDYKSAPLFNGTVKPDVFEKQIRFLKRFYTFVDLADLKNAAMNRSIRRDIVVLTFDDGYLNNYLHAYPILRKYNAPATIFLTTDFINTNNLLWYDKLAWILYSTSFIPQKSALAAYQLSPKIIDDVELFFASTSSSKCEVIMSMASYLKKIDVNSRSNILRSLAKACKINLNKCGEKRVMLSWSEVKEMSANGISFGSHTKTHPLLSAISTSEAEEEIGESKKIIEGQIQKPVTTFAYPYGEDGDYSESTVKILAEEGFEFACTTTFGAEDRPLQNPLYLKRRSASPTPFFFL